jgi:tRNA pseudouridine13 synthase
MTNSGPHRPGSSGNASPPSDVVVKEISETDKEILEKLIQKTTANNLVNVDVASQQKKHLTAAQRSVVFDPITDRQVRAQIHQVCSSPSKASHSL